MEHMQELVEVILHHSGAPPFIGDQETSFIMRLLNGKNADAEFERTMDALVAINRMSNFGEGRADAVNRHTVYALNQLIETLLFDSFAKLQQQDIEQCRKRGRIVLRAWSAIVEGDCADLRSYAFHLAP